MKYFLSEHAVLKYLETPSVYHIKKDELYELDEESFEFLKVCASSSGCGSEDAEFVQYCLDEDILKTSNPDTGAGEIRMPAVVQSPVPSLRYLELQITDRCNLRCSHCYIGDSGNNELGPEKIRNVLAEFEEMQGLRLLLTGGEPLLHSRFEEINEMLTGFMFRKVLFTNGVLLRRGLLDRLHVDEVQISIDGLETAHDLVRGAGSFRAAMAAMKLCRKTGMDVSVSTMIHAANLNDFDEMEKLFTGIGVRDWTVDVPCITGRLKNNIGLQLSPEESAKYLSYGFGGGLHTGAEGFGCGLHLMSVSADGRAAKCTFYADRPAGLISEGLAECWKSIAPVKLDELKCDCAHVAECRGGCRYRAELLGDPRGKDLYRCYSYDILN